MSKKKMKVLFWAVAAVLVFVPFLHGCASGAEEADRSGQEGQEDEAATVEEQPAETVLYGEVLAVDGNEVTVLLGEWAEADGEASGEGEDRVFATEGFAAGEDQMTFDASGVELVGADGVSVDVASLQAGDILMLEGEGEGSDFAVKKAQVTQTVGEAQEQQERQQSEG